MECVSLKIATAIIRKDAIIHGKHQIFLLLFISWYTISCTHGDSYLTFEAPRKKYFPTWESIDSRELPSWYDKAKFGIFIHWGVFSVPSFKSEWFWEKWTQAKDKDINTFMKKNYKSSFTYAEFAPKFTASFFNASQWVEMFKNSGAKYVVVTSKHHEGFTNWKSQLALGWNAVDVGPKRDLIKELETAVRGESQLYFGLYHSLFEWFNPLYLHDKSTNFSTRKFAKEKSMPELTELVLNFRPDIIWSDGTDNRADEYWNSTGFLAWLYNESPIRDSVVVNDRWAIESVCKHGGFFTCGDHYTPGVVKKHKWENCMTIDKGSWGYRRDARLSDYLNTHEIVKSLVSTVSCGGNLLLNIGPTHDGTIIPIFEERLQEIGKWLSINGEAIYSTRPWLYQNDTTNPDVWYTLRKGIVYAFLLEKPTNDIVFLGAPISCYETIIEILGYDKPLSWTAHHLKGISLNISGVFDQYVVYPYVLTFKLTNIVNIKHVNID